MYHKRGDVARIARNFHDTYESLAPIYKWETQVRSAVPYESLPTENRELMEATVERLLQQGIIHA